MARRSHAERRHEYEQQKARLAEAEVKLRLEERKARDRRLYAAGGLVEKAKLLDLEPNALYGALLSLQDGAADTQQVSDWAAIGGRSFAREARLRDEGKEPIVITYPAALPKDATARLRAAGFRFNKILQHWEGLAKPDDGNALADAFGGTARRINAPVDFGGGGSSGGASLESEGVDAGGGQPEGGDAPEPRPLRTRDAGRTLFPISEDAEG